MPSRHLDGSENYLALLTNTTSFISTLFCVKTILLKHDKMAPILGRPLAAKLAPNSPGASSHRTGLMITANI